MVVILANCVVKDKNIDEFISHANTLVNKSKKEDGCISYELCQDLKYKNKFVFMEMWQDEEAIDKHNNSKHFLEIVPKLGELQKCESEVNLYKIV